MTDRTKYDGKLTDALINTVIHAELRQWVRELASDSRLGGQTSPISQPGVTAGQPDAVCCQRAASGHTYACVNRERPTDAERAAAWVRDHGDDDC